MPVMNGAETRQGVKGGVVAGLFAGAVMSVITLIWSLLGGMDVWGAFKGAGAPFLGERAMSPGFDGPAVLVGLLSHFGVSVAWGILFGLIAYGLTRTATLLTSLAFGLVVWLGMFYVVLPAVGLAEMAAMVPVWAAIGEHLAFGLAVGIGFLPFQRTVVRRVARRPRVVHT